MEDFPTHRSPGQPGDDAGTRNFIALLVLVFHGAEGFFDESRIDHDTIGLLAHDPRGGRATEGSDLALEITHPCLAGVIGDHLVQGGGLDQAVGPLEAMFAELAFDETAFGDLPLLAFGIAVEFDDLQTIAQRARNGAEVIGSGQKEHPGKIEGHIQIVVGETMVLMRIEHLQQGAGGITSEVAADLVEFVEQDQGIARTRAADFLHEPSRHGSDVGATVPANVCFIVHAAEADADKFPSQRTRDALAQTRLADAGRSQQQQDGAVPVRFEFAHGEMLDEPAFDFFHAVVVLIENFLGMVQVQIVLGGNVPGQVGERLDVLRDDARLGTACGECIEAFEFALGLLHDQRWRGGGGQFLTQAGGDVRGFPATFAEFLLDHFHLFLQIRPALLIAELLVHILLDFLLQFRDVQLVRHLGLDGADAFGNIEFLENGLLFGGGQFQSTRDEIRELATVIEIAHQHADLFRHILLVGKIAQGRIPESIHGSFPLRSVRVGRGMQHLHIGQHVGDGLGGCSELHALQHIDDEDGVVLAFLDLTQHLHRDANAIEIRHARFVLGLAALREHADGLVAP